MEYDASLYNGIGDRLRPIFMSAGTSVLGLLPLAILPGKGAELYQGLGIALTGGLALSTFLTPTVISPLMGLLQDFQPRRSIKEQERQQEESRELVEEKSQ
nr:efflux RND transporter permease subunit [Pleurocapsa sp. PCC 7319]